MVDLVGRKLKDFYVLRRLGRGAMADVYLAQQLSLGRQVALKVLDAELARDPNYVRRFHHEARAAAALVHAGIVQIYEVGDHDGVHYIAQEFVSGRNLGELIRSRGSVPPALALDILRQVAAALGKAASEGIVHRDIKPENIMLAHTGEVKVADFGLARVAGDGGANLTQVGVTMGTPLYMSPEQIEGRQLDSRSDIYSLGVTAYHMLCGSPPFNGDTPLAVAVQHLNQPAMSPREKNPSLPVRLTEAVERMMAKKPDDRFADPAALLAELNNVLSEGAAAGWAKPDHDALAQMLRLADDRAQATSRLGEVMKTAALARQKPRSSRRAGWLWATILLGALVVGATLAAKLRPTPLLAGAQAGPAKQDTVWKQLYQANSVGTEEAWRAVLRDWTPREQYEYQHTLAEQGLALLYLREQEYEKAIDMLQKLKRNDKQAFRVFATAGMVVALTGLGEDQAALNENGELDTSQRNTLQEQSPSMLNLLNDALDELADRTLRGS